MRAPSIWKTLGIKRTQDRTEIRRAYARLLKVTNPEDDPEGFKVLRAAYERALAHADNKPVPLSVVFDEAPEIMTPDFVAPDFGADAPEAPQAEPVTPPPVDEDALTYSAACDQLEKQLKARAQASDDDRLATLARILSSPMLDNLMTRDSAELWLAQLLVRSQPRSDVLIEPVIARFGWNARALDNRQPWPVRQVFRRAADIAFRERLRKPTHEHHTAWRVLTRPPKPITFWNQLNPTGTRTEIRNLLALIRGQYPSLENDLDAACVAQWDEHLAKPGLSTFSRWMVVLAPVCVGLFIAAIFVWGLKGVATGTVLGIPPLWALGAVVYPHIYEKPRRLWQENWRLRQNGWLAFGWGPAILALLALAAAPASSWLTGIVTIVALFIVWWVSVTGEADRRQHAWPWQVRTVLAELFLMAWWLSALWNLPPGAALQMTPAVLAASLVSGFGRMPLLNIWMRLDAWTQRGALAGLTAGALAAIIFLWLALDNEALLPLAFAGGAAIILLHRVPVMSVEHWAASFRYVVAYCALFVGRTQGGILMALAFSGTILLAWAALNCLVALTRVAPQPRQKER